MNADALLAHYARIADAPDAIARLRRFVLDLAVRGKLVAQDAADEPASELLKRIAKEKARIGLREVAAPLSHEEVPFGLPNGWCWSRIGEICSKTGSGSTPRGGQSAYKDEGIPFLRSQNVYDDGLRLDDVAYIEPDTHSRMAGTAVQPADLLLNITGGSMGRCCRVPDSFDGANVSQHVAIIRTALPGMADFLHNLVLSPYFQAFIFDGQTGAGRGGLPKNKMDKIAVPLPPLAEQHRIVAKVDQLMALCDRLEAARTGREAARDRLAAASLARLNAPDPDPATFATDARFALDNLAPLTARPDQIKHLRQTILNLAVRGKLVEQDAADEPASELLKRIAAEKAQLVKAGEIRKEKPLSWPSETERHFTVPTSWSWCRFGALVLNSDSGWSPQTENHAREGDAWGVLKVSAVSWGHFDPAANKQVLPGTEPRLQAQVHKGDFLISRANTAELVARAVLVTDEPRNLMMSDKIVRLRLSSHCSQNFVWIINNYADFSRKYYAENATGVSPSMKNISRGVILELPFPLPPLAEQHRIVAKVDQLMALCDRLEASLATGDETRRRLLEALLHEALAPQPVREPELA